MKSRTIGKQISYFLLRFAGATLVVSLFFVLTQDLQLFPGAMMKFFVSPPAPPADIQAVSVRTDDGKKLVVWKLVATEKKRPTAALLFHGNAETVGNFVPLQRWFSERGITSYSLEYRGYGGSTGWPSERGLYLDAEAAYDELIETERLNPDAVIVFGSSIGSGPALYIAKKHQVGTLLLTSPFTSIPDIASGIAYFRYLISFLWYEFPNERFIGELDSTCVVAAHGRRDSTIPISHSRALQAAYQGTGTFTFIESAAAGHNDLFARTQSKIGEALEECLKERVAG